MQTVQIKIEDVLFKFYPLALSSFKFVYLSPLKGRSI